MILTTVMPMPFGSSSPQEALQFVPMTEARISGHDKRIKSIEAKDLDNEGMQPIGNKATIADPGVILDYDGNQ